MRRWGEVAARVGATTKTSEKTANLAAYLAELPPEALPIAAVFLTGRPFAAADSRSVGVGWAGLAGAVLRVAGADADALRRAYDRSSDVATAVGEVLAETGHAPDPAGEPSLGEAGGIRGHRAASGRPPRPRRWRRSWRGPPGDRGGHRPGAQRGLRIASARGSSRQRSRRRSVARSRRSSAPGCSPARGAHRALPARTAWTRRRVALFQPLKFMLASRPRTRPRSWAAWAPRSGSRTSTTASGAQLHRAGDEVRLYSRDLHDIRASSRRWSRARGPCWAGVLDGELLAWKDGVVLPFLQLQARLGASARRRRSWPRSGDLRRLGRPGLDRDATRRHALPRSRSPSGDDGSRPWACRWPRTAVASGSATWSVDSVDAWRRRSPRLAPGATRG